MFSPNSSCSAVRAWRRLRLAVERLEDRVTPVAYSLATDITGGDGSLTVGVDGYGAFGSGVGANSLDANYDPSGAAVPRGTTGQSGVAIRLNTTNGQRYFLTSGIINGAGLATNPAPITQTFSTVATSFDYPAVSPTLHFDLVQAVAPRFDGGARWGSVLIQTYTITNITPFPVDFELVRYLDANLDFDGTPQDGGGRLSGAPLPGPETLFIMDSQAYVAPLGTVFAGISTEGGTHPSSNRWQVDQTATLLGQIGGGTPLLDSTYNDLNADSFVGDNVAAFANPFNDGYGVSVAKRNVFTSLAAGSSTTYITTTIFAGTSILSQPNDIFPGATMIRPNGVLNVNEAGQTSDRYQVILNTPPTSNVTVSLSPDLNGYITVAPATLTFGPTNWNRPQTVTVTAIDDAVAQGVHQGTVFGQATSIDPNYNSLAIVPVPVSVLDNDVGVAFVQGGGSTDVTEGGASDTYTAVLRSVPTGAVTLTLASGSQVTGAPTTLVFTTANWNVPQAVTVTAIDDILAEGPHTGLITTTASSSDPTYNGIFIADVTVNIADNDFPPGVTVTETGGSTSVTEGGSSDTYSVVLNAAPTAVVTITISPDPQLTIAPAVLTFNPANWSTAQTVTVTAIDDALSSGNRTRPLTHTSASTDLNYNASAIAPISVNIIENDVPGITISAATLTVPEGSNGTYFVRLNTAPTANVVVTVTLAALLTTAPTTLTFTPTDWNVNQTVTLSAADDFIAQGTRTGLVAHAAASSDAGYNGIALVSVTVSVSDNDTAGLLLTPTGGSTDLGEGGPPTGPLSDTYTVTLTSQPAAGVVVTLTPDADVSAVPALLTFSTTNWNVAQTVTVRAVNDTLIEGTHAGAITHTTSSLDAGYNNLTSTLTANITDDENLTIPISPTSGSLSLLEGTSTSYTTALSAPPTADVVVLVNAGPLVTVSPSSLTFSPGNWLLPQRVTVTALDDSAVQGLRNETIGHQVTSADLNYNGLAMGSINVAVIDNDANFTSGTSGNDVILVAPSKDGSQMIVTVNGKSTSVPATGQLQIRAGTGNDSIQITTPLVPVTVDGGIGNDKLFVNGSATSSNAFDIGIASVTVNGFAVSVWAVEGMTVGGKSKNDTVDVQDMPNFPTEFKGDAGLDQITGPGRNNSWAITAANAGMLNGTLKFSAVENVSGGTGNDTFAFNAGQKISGRLDGGGGTDTLDYSLYTAAVTVNLQTGAATGTGGFAGIETLKGGKGLDKLIGSNQASTWNITGLNTGSAGSFAFSAVENLTGGSADDTFLFSDAAAVKGKIDAGSGTDSFDYSAYTSAVSVNLQAKTATGTGGILGVETLIGGSGTNDTLAAHSQVNAWTLRDQGKGDINGLYFFINFENFTGGSLADSFTLTAAGGWSGLLSGGGASDIIFAFGSSNVWNPGSSAGSGTLNGMRFSSIEKHQ